jgi:hypothetical protein
VQAHKSVVLQERRESCLFVDVDQLRSASTSITTGTFTDTSISTVFPSLVSASGSSNRETAALRSSRPINRSVFSPYFTAFAASSGVFSQFRFEDSQLQTLFSYVQLLLPLGHVSCEYLFGFPVRLLGEIVELGKQIQSASNRTRLSTLLPLECTLEVLTNFSHVRIYKITANLE